MANSSGYPPHRRWALVRRRPADSHSGNERQPLNVILGHDLQHLSAAGRHFQLALESDKSNIYAANGLGAVTATMGCLTQARQIFFELRESAATMSGFVRLPDVRPPISCLQRRDLIGNKHL